MLTASLSGCFSNDNGCSADEPGVIYEPGLYEVLKNEDIIYARGLAHTKTSSNPSAVPLRLDVYFPNARFVSLTSISSS